MVAHCIGKQQARSIALGASGRQFRVVSVGLLMRCGKLLTRAEPLAPHGGERVEGANASHVQVAAAPTIRPSASPAPKSMGPIGTPKSVTQ